MELIQIKGISPGCGYICRKCDRATREFCWVTRMCDLDLTDLGGPSRKEKRKK